MDENIKSVEEKVMEEGLTDVGHDVHEDGVDVSGSLVKLEKPYHPIFPGQEIEKAEGKQFYLPTYFVIIVLIVTFFILKKFIYIIDEKRNGK